MNERKKRERERWTEKVSERERERKREREKKREKEREGESARARESERAGKIDRWGRESVFIWSAGGARGGGLGSRPKKMYGERLGDGSSTI